MLLLENTRRDTLRFHRNITRMNYTKELFSISSNKNFQYRATSNFSIIKDQFDIRLLVQPILWLIETLIISQEKILDNMSS